MPNTPATRQLYREIELMTDACDLTRQQCRRQRELMSAQRVRLALVREGQSNWRAERGERAILLRASPGAAVARADTSGRRRAGRRVIRRPARRRRRPARARRAPGR